MPEINISAFSVQSITDFGVFCIFYYAVFWSVFLKKKKHVDWGWLNQGGMRLVEYI